MMPGRVTLQALKTITKALLTMDLKLRTRARNNRKISLESSNEETL